MKIKISRFYFNRNVSLKSMDSATKIVCLHSIPDIPDVALGNRVFPLWLTVIYFVWIYNKIKSLDPAKDK